MVHIRGNSRAKDIERMHSMIDYSQPARRTALDAKSEAQKLAFSPIAFQASVALVRLRILDAVAAAGDAGAAVDSIATGLGLDAYGVGVLLDMGLSIGLVWQRNGRYVLDKIGYFLLNDQMTRVNMNFVADVCYSPMAQLQESIETKAPRGLSAFGNWPTLYPGLTSLPEPARTSWFAFDHFYSAAAFGAALEIVFARPPRHVLDIGGNTGLWAVACTARDPAVRVTIVDLPEQVEAANKHLAESVHRSRIECCAADLLDESQPLPSGADVIWMSQFLDCFSEPRIIRILERVAGVMGEGSALYVLETFCDRQQHDAAAYSLNATSLYFTCIANGSSRMYRSSDLIRLIEQAGLRVADQHDRLGLGQHTLLRCVKA